MPPELKRNLPPEIPHFSVHRRKERRAWHRNKRHNKSKTQKFVVK